MHILKVKDISRTSISIMDIKYVYQLEASMDQQVRLKIYLCQVYQFSIKSPNSTFTRNRDSDCKVELSSFKQ